MLIQERIQVILKMHQLSPSMFADKIGVQRSSVSHVLSGRNKPGLDFLEKILVHFPRVNAHWLITGKITDVKNAEKESGVKSQEVDRLKSIDSDTVDVKNEDQIDRIMIFFKDGTFKSYRSSVE
jgi:transcriptional regulator with XRE-family HTH domain